MTLPDGSTEHIDVNITVSASDAGEYHFTTESLTENTYNASEMYANYEIMGGAMLYIDKADPTYKAPVPNELTYDGEFHELVSAGSVKGDEMLYSLFENGPYTNEIPSGTEVGKYTVWFRIIGDNNHNDILTPKPKIL